MKYFRTRKLIKRIDKNDKILAIICYSQLLQTQSFLFFLSKFMHAKILLERSEHPLRNYQGSFLKQSGGEIKTYIESKLCNGINCISQYLVDFYKKKGVNQNKLFLVPSTVDPERFQTADDSILPFTYISYCGSLTLKRMTLNILMKVLSGYATSIRKYILYS